MLKDFKKALARVQSNYGFYIECQADPAVALAGYDLSPDERSALIDPKKLADALRPGVGISHFKITISGTHDWVNRAAPKRPKTEGPKREARIARQLEAIRHANASEQRTEAAVGLMELIG
jgi:hypothetical protein